MTRTVRDAALMFSAMARFDLRDPFCLPDEARDWRDGIEDGVAGLRVAMLRRPGFEAPLDADGAAALERPRELLAEAGAEVEEADPGLPDTRDDLRPGVGRGAGAAGGRCPTRSSGRCSIRAWPSGRGAAGHVGDPEFLDAEAMRLAAAHAMARFSPAFDLVLCPAVPAGPPLADAPTVRAGRGAVDGSGRRGLLHSTSHASRRSRCRCGPAQDGLPRSVQVAAALYRDDLVLRAARGLELASPFATAPAAA